MDISQITDITQLKALAYDEMMKLEAAQSNLRLLNNRIGELQQQQQPMPIEPPKEPKHK
jgi:uncharacterized coiled-coil protein SlyX